MKTIKQLDKYNKIWLSMSAYHDLTPKNKSYEAVSQWNGKKMKEISWYLIGVVTQSLRGGSRTQCPIFNHASESTWVLLEIYMDAQYKSDDDAALSNMEDALCRCFTFKDGFLLRKACKIEKAKANALRTELVNKLKVDKEKMLKLGRCQRYSAN